MSDPEAWRSEMGHNKGPRHKGLVAGAGAAGGAAGGAGAEAESHEVASPLPGQAAAEAQVVSPPASPSKPAGGGGGGIRAMKLPETGSLKGPEGGGGKVFSTARGNAQGTLRPPSKDEGAELLSLRRENQRLQRKIEVMHATEKVRSRACLHACLAECLAK